MNSDHNIIKKISKINNCYNKINKVDISIEKKMTYNYQHFDFLKNLFNDSRKSYNTIYNNLNNNPNTYYKN